MQNPSFKLFLDYFPTVELPVMLGDEEHHLFSAQNEALPTPLIYDFLLAKQIDETAVADAPEDEFVEYIPCFQLANQENFHAIVYWKADLLAYDYVMMTFDKNGKRIDAKPIGGMRAKGQDVQQSVTQIDEEGFIIIAEGTAHYASNDLTEFDAEDGRIRRLELRHDGAIMPM